MKIINTINDIFDIYSSGSFDINKWNNYINRINSKLGQLCVQDMNEAINTGQVSFKKDYLSILNNVINQKEKLDELQKNFIKVTESLEDNILKKFNKTIDVEIVLYLGLFNGAGWVAEIENKVYCLLGIEKILELDWYDMNSLYGLIYHELGHVYQKQYGVLEREFDNNKHQFLWQLFTEGIAMYFEQTLIADYEYYHQDKNDWKAWCDNHIKLIAQDFNNELDIMTFDNQRYFGDWVYYDGYSDTGYYLGTKFTQYICKQYDFDDILSREFISLSIKTIDKKGAKITAQSLINSVFAGFHSKKSLREPKKGHFFMQNC